MAIHPTAIVDSSSEVDPTAEIGAYAIVEGDAKIGAGVVLHAHAYVGPHVTLGERVQVYPFAVVGGPPQDVKFKGERSYTVIGADTVLREGSSVHRGTMPESTTTIGARCMLMATAHVGHNCTLADDVTLVNSSLLAGHVTVGRRAFLSGNGGAHQFVRIGELVMLAGGAIVVTDVPPYMTVARDGVAGVNVVGLRRAGFDSATRQEIRRCFHVLYRQGLTFPRAVERLAEMVVTPAGRTLLEFLQSPSKRGWARARRQRGPHGRDAHEVSEVE